MIVIVFCLKLIIFITICHSPWLIVAEMFEAKYVATASESVFRLRVAKI